jgi:clan AA aspartic protease (TIGR02281 family)
MGTVLAKRSGKMKFIIPFIMMLAVLVPSSYGDMYKWVDEKGTVHFTDDLSNIPENYRPEVEIRNPTKETSAPQPREISKPSSSIPMEATEPGGFEVKLVRKHELWMAEVLLNGSVKRQFIVDTGASFSLIDSETAREIGITIDDNTPFIPASTVSGVILTPLVILKSMRVGDAELENVEVSIHDMPSKGGLLGNSFLNRFKVVIDSLNEKMTLFSMEGKPSEDRPGGYSRDYWEGQFRFYYRILDRLKEIKIECERKGAHTELVHVTNAIRYFENHLSELERRASFAGVPRNWRQ